jgi:hypothetical protein
MRPQRTTGRSISDFSGGWLTVKIGEPGASADDEFMHEVLSMQIAPFGIIDISPDQICDMLGLTINGSKVPVPQIAPGSEWFDWSGETTYWISTHRLAYRDDVENLQAAISRSLPGSILIQPSYGSHGKVRCREVAFMIDTDRMMWICVDGDIPRLRKLLDDPDARIWDYHGVFGFRIDLSREDYAGRDVTGRDFIRSRGANDLELKYDVTYHRLLRIWTEFSTANARAQACMKDLLAIINEYFCRDLQIVNLQSGAVIGDDVEDEQDSKSYSRALRAWCLERPDRYISVGMNRTPDGDVFLGYRPKQDAV